MSDAKPCPFCGSDELFYWEYPFKRKPGLKGCYVKCKVCNASTGNYETVDDALKAWNMRKDTEENE